jgi:hypothetical protein
MVPNVMTGSAGCIGSSAIYGVSAIQPIPENACPVRFPFWRDHARGRSHDFGIFQSFWNRMLDFPLR